MPTAELVCARARPGAEHSDSQIRGLRGDGLAERRLFDQNGFERRSRIAPDGNHVVFARRRRNNDPTSQELFVTTIDGAAPEVRLTNDAAVDDAPCWSPDGLRIVFQSDRLGSGARLFRCDADGSNQTLLLDDGAELGDPDWNAASGRIAFTRTVAGAATEIWTMRPDGTDTARVTDGGPGGVDRQPSWSPDGRTLLMVRTLDPARAVLASVDVATGVVTPLTLPFVDFALPRFSPRGDRVYFAAADPTLGIATLRLATMRSDGSDALLLAPDDRYDIAGIDCMPGLAPIGNETLTWTAVTPSRALVSNLFGTRTAGRFDDVLESDGTALVITTAKQGTLQIGGAEFTVPLGVDPVDVRAVEVTVVAGVGSVDAATKLRVTIADYVAQRHATMVLLTPTGTATTTRRFTIGGLRCVDRHGDVRVSVVMEKAVDTPGDLSIDYVGVRVRHVERP